MSFKVCKSCRTTSKFSEDGKMCKAIFLGSLGFSMFILGKGILVKLEFVTSNVSWMMIMVGAFSKVVFASMSIWVLNSN